MGQKVHPYGFRLGYNKNWQSRWFSKKDYPAFVYEDHEVRKYVKKLLYSAGISKIEIERAGGKIRLILSTARPGIVIGRKGVEIEKLRNDLRAKFGREFSLEVNEIRRPEGKGIAPCLKPWKTARAACLSVPWSATRTTRPSSFALRPW